MITEKQAKEYFVKLMCDSYSKEDLARAIWKEMSADKRNPYFKELEEMEKKNDKDKKER